MDWAAAVKDDVTGARNGEFAELTRLTRPLPGKITVNICVQFIVSRRLQNKVTCASVM